MRNVPATKRWVRRAGAVLVLGATLFTVTAIAAPPTLESVAVTPAASSIQPGETQLFKATGTFSNGSTRALGPAVVDIAPGSGATCVLLSSGGVNCWGNNSHGELGDASFAPSLVPRRVKRVSGATDVVMSRTTPEHACALLVSGAIKCWGWNYYGQLGNGTATIYRPGLSSPVAVTGIDSATAVAAGERHTCALLASGAVKCWGENSYGALGDGTNADSSVPVSVAGINTATAIAAGEYHSCAVLASGVVQCWGQNDFGELGDGTYTGSNAPVTVVGIDDATAIAAGNYFSCALRASGAVQCWGMGGDGQLGSSEPNWSSIPVTIALPSTAVAITAGGWHVCAVMTRGDAQCWGGNYFGELGNGLTSEGRSYTPVVVSGIKTPVTLAAGHFHTCALLPDGAMRCWGLNDFGQLGNRRTTGNLPNRWPVNVVGTPGVVWASSYPAKATINDGGRATGRSSGNTTITATTAGFINDSAVLNVK